MTNPNGDVEELQELQREAQARRSERKQSRASAKSTAPPQSAAPDAEDQEQTSEPEKAVKELAVQIEGVVKDLEQATVKHPALALAAAFGLGIAVGKLFSRR